MNSPISRYRRGRLALAVSGGYFAVVVAVAVLVQVVSQNQDGSLAGVWLILVTLPISLLIQFTPVEGFGAAALLVAGGLLQACLLWLVLRGSRK